MTQVSDTARSRLATLGVGLVRDVYALMHQEMALARHEVQYDIGKSLKGLLWCGIAVVLAGVGLLGMAAAGVLLLVTIQVAAWACTAIVSVILLGGSCGLVLAGREVVKSVHFIPLRTLRTLVDDAKWIA